MAANRASGARRLEIADLLATSTVAWTMHAPTATHVASQPPRRTNAHSSGGIDREIWPQYHREACAAEVERERRAYSSVRSPITASRSRAGSTHPRIQLDQRERESCIRWSSIGSSTRQTFFESPPAT